MGINILLADDRKILRQTLRIALENGNSFKVIAEAANGREAVNLTRKLHPDIVLMDVSMPVLNGVEACRQILTENEGTRVLALSEYSGKRYVERMLEAGATGYLVKDCSMNELSEAIKVVADGKTYLSPDIAAVVVDGFLDSGNVRDTLSAASLTPREREVVQLIAEGNTTKEIAAQLHVSDKTIETHRRQMMIKLKLSSIAELTKFAVREGLTTLDM